MHERSQALCATGRFSMTVLGDSLAYGLGASKSEHSLAHRFYIRLRAQHPGSTYANLAVPHSTMGDVLRHQVPQLHRRQSDLVLLIAGANDLRYTRDTIVFARRFRHLLQSLHLSSPHARIIAGGMPDVTQTIGVPRLLKPAVSRLCRRLNSTMREIVTAHNDHFLDMFAFTNAPLRADPALLLCEDGYHPNDEGYAEISDRAYPALMTAISALA